MWITLNTGLTAMFFSGSPKHKMLLGVVGPSISCGLFLGLAINQVEKGQAFSCVLMILMSLMTLYVAIASCKKGSEIGSLGGSRQAAELSALSRV
jgi:hypothetical protein